MRIDDIPAKELRRKRVRWVFKKLFLVFQFKTQTEQIGFHLCGRGTRPEEREGSKEKTISTIHSTGYRLEMRGKNGTRPRGLSIGSESMCLFSDDPLMQGLALFGNGGLLLSHTPPNFTPGSYEVRAG